jgi:hypothetical protein
MAGDLPRRDANGNLIFTDQYGNPVQQPLPAAPPMPEGLFSGPMTPEQQDYVHRQFMQGWATDPMRVLADSMRPDAVNGPGLIGNTLMQMGVSPDTAGGINRSILRGPARMLGGTVDIGTGAANAGIHGLNALNNLATGGTQKPNLLPDNLPGSSQWIAERVPFVPTQAGNPTADAIIDSAAVTPLPAVARRAAALMHAEWPEVLRVLDPQKARETSKEIGKTWADWARQRLRIGVVTDAEAAAKPE